MPDPKKVRNKSSNPGVPKNREEIYKEVIKRYNKAIEDEYYLEAICLSESLICDRLESRLGELKQTDILFDVLGPLCSKLISIETNANLKVIYKDINSNWRHRRNDAIHQAAKISIASVKVWQDFLDEAKATAEEGLILFRKLDNEIEKARR